MDVGDLLLLLFEGGAAGIHQAQQQLRSRFAGPALRARSIARATAAVSVIWWRGRVVNAGRPSTRRCLGAVLRVRSRVRNSRRTTVADFHALLEVIRLRCLPVAARRSGSGGRAPRSSGRP
jgi:hypothetical protein